MDNELLWSISFWQFVEYGVEGSIMLLQTCMDQLNFFGTDSKNMQLESVVASIFRYLLDKPNFSTVFFESLRNTEINEGTLENFSDALHLSVSEKIAIGLALSDSENLEVKSGCQNAFVRGMFPLHLLSCVCIAPFNRGFFFGYLGKSFCMAQIEELCANPVLLNSSERIQNIVMFLQRSEALSKHVDSFMQMLSFVQSNDVAPFVLTPFLSDELREANFLR